MTFNWKRTIPQIVKDIRDGLVYFFGAILICSPLVAKYTGIPVEDIAPLSGLFIVAVKAGAKFFGVSTEEANENVRKAKEEVAEIKNQ